MKKQDNYLPTNKLAFSKEKVANLSQVDLDHIQGGLYPGESGSTHAKFTCSLCTTIGDILTQ